MTDTDKIKAGLAQMDFEMVDNGVFEMPASTPATYNFTEPATFDPNAFEAEIDDRGFSYIGKHSTEKDDGSFYYTVDVVTDHYKKVAVKVWRDTANLYPKEELVDTYEVSRIVHAIEEGFQSELEHTNDWYSRMRKLRETAIHVRAVQPLWVCPLERRWLEQQIQMQCRLNLSQKTSVSHHCNERTQHGVTIRKPMPAIHTRSHIRDTSAQSVGLGVRGPET